MTRTQDLLRTSVLAAALLSVSAAASTQTAAGTAAAKPADVATPDAIIDAVYASISGPAGQPRDWITFRSLLIPGGRLIPSARRTPGATTPVVWSARGGAFRRSRSWPGEAGIHRTRDSPHHRSFRCRAARL